jgi:hypothetical protein
VADTGSPWNIPYVENTDLVKDYPIDSLALANAVAAGLDAAANAGIGTNVVAGQSTNTVTTTSTSFVTVTGVTATITPTSATSKVLVIFTAFGYGEAPGAGGTANFQIRRDSTVIFGPYSTTAYPHSAVAILDSPTTGSPIVYDVQHRESGGGTTQTDRGRIHVIEVAA